MHAIASGFAQRALPDLIDNLPNLSGWEAEIQAATQSETPIFLPTSNLRSRPLRSTFAIALKMDQAMIPTHPPGAFMSHLQYMFEHPFEDDNHQAGPLLYAYSRMGDFIPELIEQGCNPRISLAYSGSLLWSLQSLGRRDSLNKLKRITNDPTYQPHVEWLGSTWANTPLDAIPAADMALQLRSWQHHFATAFGLAALKRVKGFASANLQLPNHPHRLYPFLQALKTCGYRWLLLSPQGLAQFTGTPITQPHLPHRLVVQDGHGAVISMVVLLQSASTPAAVSDISPYLQAKTLNRPQDAPTHPVMPLAMQMADGVAEPGMMNQFPGHFKRLWHELRQCHPDVAGVCGTEYLELLAADGYSETQYPVCSVVVPPAYRQATPTASTHPHPTPSERLSALFHQAIAAVSTTQKRTLTRHPRYRQALIYNLLLQAECFQVPAGDRWAGYSRDLYRRGVQLLKAGL